MYLDEGISTSKKIITFSIYGAFFLIGITLTVFGPTMSYLMEGYSISLAQAGLFVTFMALGRMLSVVFCGMLSDYIGNKWIVVMGTACLTAGLIGIGSLSIFSVAIIFAFIAGIGHGAVDTSASSAMMNLYPDKTSSALNKANMFFAVGCLIGPLVYGVILSYTVNWRIVYYTGAAAGIFITLVLVFQVFPDTYRTVERSRSISFKCFFGSLNVWLLAMIMFLYSGAGHSINTWVNKYMGDVVKLSVLFASGSLAIYNLGLALGRFVCSLIAENMGYYRLMLFSTIGGLGAIVLALFSHSVIIMMIGLGLTGFFFGGLFPTAIAIGGQLYPKQKGGITGVLVMMAALGSMTIPAVTGVLSQLIGMDRGMKSLVVWGVLMVLTAYISRYYDQRNREV